MEQEHVAGFHDHVVGRHDLLELRELDRLRLVAEVVREVDEHAATLHAVERHVLEPEVVREAPVPGAVAARVVARSDEVDTGAVAVVVDGLGHPVAVGVELAAHVRERVPLRRVLQPERHLVVGPDVGEGVVALADLAHRLVVEDLRGAVHVLGRREARRVAALVERGAAGEVERQAEAERDAVLDLADALEHLLGGDEVDAAELVVVAEIAPGGALRTLRPTLRHGVPLACSFPVPIGTLAGSTSTRRGSRHGGTQPIDGSRGLGRRPHPRAHRPLQDASPQAPARPRGVGRGLRDRAARRGRRHHVPSSAHAGLRRVDRLALPPDRWAHARGRSRDHPRGPRRSTASTPR